MPAHVILGAQWGDEGKGKIVDFLASGYDAVARFQGGNNAGHTVIVGDNTFKLHLIPSGVVAGVPVAIGNGVVVDPTVFLKELDGLLARGLTPNVTVSPRAHVIMPWHLDLDGASEEASGETKIGTTRRGIGPCYTDKAARRGVRIGDLVDRKRLKARVEAVWPAVRRTLAAWGVDPMPDPHKVVADYAKLGERLAPMVGDVGDRLEGVLAGGGNVLLEGAQGILLDVDHGTYPFVTSSSATTGYASAGSGIPAQRVEATLGVAKAYTTRVGEGPFPTELDSSQGVGRRLVEVGREVGTTTGRPRRVGWLDLVALRYAARVGGITHMAITKLDVLAGVETVRVASTYSVNGTQVTSFPEDAAVLAAAEPVYEDYKGWDVAEEGDALSGPVTEFLEAVGSAVGVPVVFASVGPARHATRVVASNPFTGILPGAATGGGTRASPPRT